MIGFPLRLLAREIYDRVVALKGVQNVALITGEERIEPPEARWYCCTVESMPIQKEFAFVAIDEAQLGADPERGHIFTDRILRARGREETMILGSESLRPIIRALLPDAEIISRPRFSTLSYAGAKKLSRLPKRSAIVAFSIEQVYAVAETLRRMRGGAAVVMGALSPRTRNAQVAMFQSGEVDYLVATDAIGMGLNLDVAHVAFVSLSKFDGSRRRRLTVAEMAQIAGRAGRHQRDGSFGTLAGEGSEFTPEEVLAIEAHNFPRLDWLYWREAKPRFNDIATLISDLEKKPHRPGLLPAPKVIDLLVLKRLAEMPDVNALIRHQVDVARLWEVACLPDFRQMGEEHHSRFVASLWQYLGQNDRVIPQGVYASELARLDNIQGDVDTLSARIAAVRTWTYIAHRSDWLTNPPAMPELPPESAVHLKVWNFANASEARNAGYRRIGDEYVRIDLAERVIKKAHEARGQGNLFGMDMAFATSLGISENGLRALMRDAGFRSAEQPPEPQAEVVAENVAETVDVVAAGSDPARQSALATPLPRAGVAGGPS